MARSPARSVSVVSPGQPAPLQGGGGDGTSGGMEACVAVLEADVGHIKAHVADLRADMCGVKVDLSALKTDVAVLNATMASKGFVGAVVVGTGAVLGAITTFAPFIQRLLGIVR